MVDQPARGRSPWLPDVDGKLATFTAERIESRFTAPQDHGIHVNAHMIMLEKNNLQVAAAIGEWLARTIPVR